MIAKCCFHRSSEENHLPHFRKSDVISDATLTSSIGKTSHANFRDNIITAKADNNITKSTGTIILQTSS